MRKIQMILNQKAAVDDRLRQEIYAFREKGHQIRVQVIWEYESIPEIIFNAIEDGYETVVAAGGDGTLNLVVNSVLKSKKTNMGIGVLPYGTANDFARSCDVFSSDPVKALRVVIENDPTPIDVGMVNGQYFINVASGGLVAEITTSTPEPIKRLLGGVAYSITGALKMFSDEQCKATITAEGFEWEGTLSIILVCNGQYAGGGIQISDKAFVDDGMLEVAIIPKVTFDQYETVIREFFDQGNVDHEHVQTISTPWLKLHLDNEMQLNLDGEPIHASEFDFTLRTNCVNFHLPKSSCILNHKEQVT